MFSLVSKWQPVTQNDIFFTMLWIEFRGSQMPDKCSITESLSALFSLYLGQNPNLALPQAIHDLVISSSFHMPSSPPPQPPTTNTGQLISPQGLFSSQFLCLKLCVPRSLDDWAFCLSIQNTLQGNSLDLDLKQFPCNSHCIILLSCLTSYLKLTYSLMLFIFSFLLF